MQIYFNGLIFILMLGIIPWLYTLYVKKVCIVDSLWSLAFIVLGFFYFYHLSFDSSNFFGQVSDVNKLLLILLLLWGLRLSLHITYKNWGKPEDARYQAIRANNEPYFSIKSIYIVFGLQGFLAWVISAPIFFTLLENDINFNWIHYVAIAIFTLGFTFESVGDWQLLNFKKDKSNAGLVLNSGLWYYTRHPNYFGDCCVWWSFYLFALAASHPMTLFSPLLMTLLLLKVSGVSLQEKTIADRRPEYRAYQASTNAFFPGPKK